MGRDEFIQLRDALTVVVEWSAAVRAEVARWLGLTPETRPPSDAAPSQDGRDGTARHDPRRDTKRASAPPLREAAKPNGGDPSPLAVAPAVAKPKAKRRGAKPDAKAFERKLIEALRDNPGLTVAALANAVGASRSAAGQRLREMALRGVIEKGFRDHWRLTEEAAANPPTSPPSP